MTRVKSKLQPQNRGLYTSVSRSGKKKISVCATFYKDKDRLNKNLYVLLHRMNLYEIVDLGKKMAGLLYAEK